MKSRIEIWMTLVCLLAGLTMTARMAAQENLSSDQGFNLRKYKLIDLGTFGGANSQVNGGPPPMLNDVGTVAGEADTSTPCSYFDGFVSPAFKWQHGVLINMGLLPGGCFSLPNSINSKGMMVGSGDIGVIDPLTGLQEIRADFRYKGQIINMGTFGGTNSLAGSINSSGQATGFAENTDPDPWNFGGLSNLPSPTAWHGFIWQNGVLEDLETLGGPDSAGFVINEQGQIAGFSFTNDTPNPVTGIPTLAPFLWQKGVGMTNVGTLGGTFGFGNSLNNHGHVVGFSDLAGDLRNHAFFWDGTLTDIGTLKGPNSNANWVNDADQVVGISDLPGGATHHAFFWQKGTEITDIGTIGSDPCSNGYFINASGQVIGTTTDCHGTILHTFLWEKGSIVDLSAQVLPGSGFIFVEPVAINDGGEIVGNGGLSNGDLHAVVLKSTSVVPTKGDHNAVREASVAVTLSNTPSTNVRQNSVTAVREAPAFTPLDRLRRQIRQQYHVPGQAVVPSD